MPRHKLSARKVRTAAPGKYNGGAGLWLVKRHDGGQWVLLTCPPRGPDLHHGKDTSVNMKRKPLDEPTISEIIEMALSDHASFDQIRTLHGLGPDEVKALMRQTLKSGSYRAWRRRVRILAVCCRD
jgi:uncharacterized protein (TIGR03643 family)